MPPDTAFAWSMLAAFLAGAGITLELLQVPAAIASLRHLLRRLRHHHQG